MRTKKLLPYVEHLHRRGGFVSRCKDPVLRELVLEQAKVLDSAKSAEDTLMAAELEAAIVGCIMSRAAGHIPVFDPDLEAKIYARIRGKKINRTR